ncbi:carboxylesterase family protein [Pseudonocardia sp. RS11V-5]|uniref:carboxylesterase/lipase family protein n=1 Tax=Pseudonocardia terrae TaxID=2905831 RepID=UPI001E5EC1A2|nr:carboxylesterase family protein [Pseudonocardia terrae]MCE3555820.1 carboxylesterase family protein [Pseudonocardia terrae]
MAVITTRLGRLEGVTLTGGIERFTGVPYAEAPIGALRFREAQERTPWAGIRDATRPGPTSPQAEVDNPLHRRLAASGWVRGDDTLNLNVWTADRSGAAPVCVWIYGGAFKEGNGLLPLYDGAAFARDGIVAVSIQYRVGLDGFGLFEGGPANLGLRDQVAALRWVRDHIADFGGDPGRVTVFGQSAGGASVARLLSAPAVRGLIHRGINQSGPVWTGIEPEQALRTTHAVARCLGIPATPEALAAVPEEVLLAATLDVAGRPGDPGSGSHPLSVVADPDFPAVPAFADAAVPVLAGFCSDEFGLFSSPDPDLDRAAAVAELKEPGSEDLLDALHDALPAAGWGTLVRKVREHDLFVGPLLDWMRDAAAAGVPVHGYEFGWRTRALDGAPGACHNLELPFVFDLLDREHVTDLTGPEPPRALADRMHGDWVRFMRDGLVDGRRADGTTESLQVYDGGDEHPRTTGTVDAVCRAHVRGARIA